jgi:hypothetical protein
MFEQVDITPQHPIHTHGQMAPVSKLYKLPIVVYRHTRTPWMDREDYGEGDADLDNQPATYLMIEKDGFAKPE